MIIKNSARLNIDLNAKDNGGRTAFHWACYWYRSTNVIDIMINNSESFNLDLTARDNDGQTGFQMAQERGRTNVVNMIQTKMSQIAF